MRRGGAVRFSSDKKDPSGFQHVARQRQQDIAQHSYDDEESAQNTQQLTVEQEKELLQSASHSISELLSLCKQFPSNVHFPLKAARELAKCGRLDEAAAIFREAEAKAPSPADRSFVLVGWGTQEMHTGKESTAEELLIAAREAAPDMAAPINALAKLQERRGNLKEAEKMYKQALELQPTNFVSLQSLAVLYSKLGQHKQASSIFEKTVELVPNHAPTWQAWGLHEWKQGRYAAARDLFEQGIEKCKPHGPLLVAYAKMEAQRRNRTKARKLLREAAHDVEPRNAHTWVTWAQLEGRAGNHAAAIEICKSALEINPDNVYILCTLGQVYSASGNEENAVKAWEEALAIDFRCAVAAHELGSVARQKGDIIKAEELFQLGIGSGDAKGALRCAIALAELRLFQGSTPQSVRTIFEDISTKHKPDGRLLREWAGVEKRLGNLTAAASLYKRAAQTDPRDERTWLQWGQLERRRGEIDTALQCWRKGLKVSPLNPFLWQLCGVTLWEAGQIDVARATFKQGLKYCPTNQALLLEWAVKEASLANTVDTEIEKKERLEAGLDILRLSASSPLSSAIATATKPHVPLLALWAQLARKLGYEDEACEVEGRMKPLMNNNGGQKRGGQGTAVKKRQPLHSRDQI